MKMIKIGELSKLTNIPIKTIRFYKEEHLISPVEVDRWTGYRYYDETSINRLSEIIYLKDLGFSLKEIQKMSPEVVAKKLEELNVKLKKIRQNISTLSDINKEGMIMKNFVNDQRVIGKWKRVGIVSSEENFKAGKYEDNKSEVFDFNEIYFLPKGEEYWVFSWSKGKLFVKDFVYNYKIVDGKMLIFINDKYSHNVDDIAVYEQVDHREYKVEEIRIKDNTNLPFIMDERIVGAWEVYNYIDDPKTFDPKTLNLDSSEQWQTQLVFDRNGNCSWITNDGEVTMLNWTKGYLINKYISTTSAYEIANVGKDEYLIIEWKSGDYIYGGRIYGYYVYKKIK